MASLSVAGIFLFDSVYLTKWKIVYPERNRDCITKSKTKKQTRNKSKNKTKQNKTNKKQKQNKTNKQTKNQGKEFAFKQKRLSSFTSF